MLILKTNTQISQISRQAFESPLNQIPGPWLAKFTPYYIILIDAAGNRTQHIHKLHQRYGPVIRIGPEEVSFASPSAIKEIYSQGTPYLKAPWYDYMTVPPAGVFSLRDRKDHADRRRLLSHAFSQSALNDAEPIMAELIAKMIYIVNKAAGEPLNMLLLCRRLSLDLVGQLFLGQSFQALDTKEPPEFLEWMDNLFLGHGIEYAFPIIFWLMKILPIRGAQEIVYSAVKIHEYARKAFSTYIEENGRQSKRHDLLTKILVANGDAEISREWIKPQPLTDKETIHEIGNLVFAGTGTYLKTRRQVYSGANI